VRLGRIPYLNCEPFFARLAGAAEAPALTPRELGRAAAAGDLDAGPFSLVDLLALGGDFLPLPFGIAAPRRAQSVLLFSRRPLADLGGGVVGVTDETSTSVQLLRVLLALRYQVEPRAWVGAGEPADALLLIGDRALRALDGGQEFPLVADLGREWVEWTGLPAVFARWGVRACLPLAERGAFERALDVALEAALADLPALARERRDVGLPEAEVVAYLKGFTYRFGPEEGKAIAEFVRLRDLLEEPLC
jgi:chorismate dehydratase